MLTLRLDHGFKVQTGADLKRAGASFCTGAHTTLASRLGAYTQWVSAVSRRSSGSRHAGNMTGTSEWRSVTVLRPIRGEHGGG